MQAGGGTEMLPALNMALTSPGFVNTGLDSSASESNVPKSYVRQVIFITDGAVGNEQALMSEVQDKLVNTRLFTVGIGSAPNSYFMRKMAQFGRGTFTYIGQVSEFERKMDQLFKQLNSPQLTQLSIHWPQGTEIEPYPQQIADLYAGEPLLIMLKSNQLKGSVELRGYLANSIWRQELVIDPTLINKEQNNKRRMSNKGIATLWARDKISTLLDKKTAGRNQQEVRAEVLTVALQHQLKSPYTSFVAVEQQVSRTTATLAAKAC